MKNHSEYNADRLTTTSRATDRARHLAWIMNAASLLLLILLAAAIGDYRKSFMPSGRWLSFCMMGLVVAFAVWRLMSLVKKPTGIKNTALSIEARRPELGCVVSTAAEYLSGERKPSQEYEPELVDALQEQAARRLLLVEIPCYRSLIRPGVFLSLFLGATLLFVVLAPGALTSFARIVAPWSKRTYTSVVVKPGNGEIPVGRDLNVEATFGGRPPKDPLLRWREQSGTNWQSLPLVFATNNLYTGIVPKVRVPIRYQVSGNDAVSPEYTMGTYIPPEVKSFEIEVQLPAYTKAQPSIVREPNLEVLRASQLSFRITASCALATARLRFADQPVLPLKSGISNAWNGTLKVTNELYYWVELADAAGHKGGNEKPYHITVLPDAPPKVEIVDPGMDVRAEATNRVALKISATDDYGVNNLKLVFRKLSEPEQSVTCTLTNSGQKKVEAANSIDLTPLHLKEYEVVAYHAEAQDNNTLDGPGVGKSPVYFIEYTTKGEPLSQCNGSGQKINLLQIEKQIIAATFAINEASAAEKLPQIAPIQRQAKTYAEIFKKSFVLSVSPPEARTEFDAAIAAMESAANELDAAKRSTALAAEDKALEHLYQVVRLLPELEKSMCKGGNCTKIVLEAIEKVKEEQKKKREQELPKILSETRKLAAEQAKLSDIYRQSQKEISTNSQNNNSPSSAPKNGSKPGSSSLSQQAASKTNKNELSKLGENTNSPSTAQKDGIKPGPSDLSRQGASNGTSTALFTNKNELSKQGGNTNSPSKEAKSGSAKSDQQLQARNGSNSSPKPSEQTSSGSSSDPRKSSEGASEGQNDQTSKEQQRLSESAAALAEKLREISKADPRVNSDLYQTMASISYNMSLTARAPAAHPWRGIYYDGDLELAKVIKELEHLLAQDTKPTDVAAEDYPKEYESLISEYLRSLSFTE